MVRSRDLHGGSAEFHSSMFVQAAQKVQVPTLSELNTDAT